MASLRSQDRQHAGKRGAALRKARREGYIAGKLNPHWWLAYSADKRAVMFQVIEMMDFPASPLRAAEYRHGARDYARKHGNETR